MKEKKRIPLVDDFVGVKKKRYSRFTLRNYKNNLLEFNRYLKERGRVIPEFTAEDFETYIGERMESGLATSTITGKLWSIKTFSKFLWYRDLLSDKELKAIDEYYPDLPKNEDTRRPLSEDEVKDNLKILKNPMYRMLFFVGVNYGLRTSEYEKLKVSDVNLTERFINVHGKGNKFRKIKIIR
ncbi:MAG: tyrosine-type recombinase/integrase, partial [Candidatus Hodarchaeota archaeon]